MTIDVKDIQIINKAIPPSTPGCQPHHATPHFHGSSKSLNMIIGYKTTPQYPLHAIDTISQRDVHNLVSYAGELNYNTAGTPHGSNKDIRSLYSTEDHHNVNKMYLPSRQNSIICAQNPRFSTYGYPHTVVLSQGSSELEKHQAADIPNYGKLAWFACIFFFPLGLIALKKHYETRKFRYRNPDKARAASDVTRFFGAFSILLGIVLYALIVVIRLRLSYENGEKFI
ncbi:uncharacterized protein [Clytia hemisphaerica]|uniref:Uncharacterized protein n=1 Tax=Clytia hemisphaerica TaxID=252671 RepID=A0A7M6DLC2_9CNID